jgi:hypothetical protein
VSKGRILEQNKARRKGEEQYGIILAETGAGRKGEKG